MTTIVCPPQAIPDSALATDLPHTTVEQRAIAINTLLNAHRLQVFQNDGDPEPTYRAVHQEETLK